MAPSRPWRAPTRSETWRCAARRSTSTRRRSIARDLFGREGEVRELGSNQDRNYRVDAADGRFVLKIANPGWEIVALEAQNAAMSHLAARDLPFAVPSRGRLAGRQPDRAADARRRDVRDPPRHLRRGRAARRHALPLGRVAAGGRAHRRPGRAGARRLRAPGHRPHHPVGPAARPPGRRRARPLGAGRRPPRAGRAAEAAEALLAPLTRRAAAAGRARRRDRLQRHGDARPRRPDDADAA